MDKVDLIRHISSWVFLLWNWAGVFASVDKALDGKLGIVGDFSRKFISEVKPFYFPILVVWFVTQTMVKGPHWGTPLMTAWYIVLYFIYKKYDDDRWKKRKEKLLEKIEVAEGKLVVVPTT